MTIASDGSKVVVTVGNRLGLHARPASRLVKMLADYPGATVTLTREDNPGSRADCRSILALIILAAGKGTRLVLSGRGENADAAVSRIADFFAGNFDEE